MANPYTSPVPVPARSKYGGLRSRGTIGGFVYPKSIAFTPHGTRAYVVNENAFRVSVIATDANSVVATIPVGLLPSAVVSADGSTAYVPNLFGLWAIGDQHGHEFRDGYGSTYWCLSGGSRCALSLRCVGAESLRAAPLSHLPV